MLNDNELRILFDSFFVGLKDTENILKKNNPNAYERAYQKFKRYREEVIG